MRARSRNSCSQDWRDNQNSLIDKIHYLHENTLFTDLTIVLYDENQVKKEFEVHSVFLFMASSALAALVNSDFIEKQKRYIEIKDASPHIFQLLLKYVYGETVNLKCIEEAWELYTIANKYLMLGLEDFCFDYIGEHINPSNVCLSLEMANRFGIAELSEYCLQTIQNKTSDVVSDHSFLDIELKTIETILDQEELSIKEFDLFRCVEKWIRSYVDKKGESVQESLSQLLMPKFRFNGMSAKEFTNGPVSSNLLSSEQQLHILTNLSSEDSPYAWPEQFSTKKREMACPLSKFKHNLLLTTLPKRTQYFLAGRNVQFEVSENIYITGIKIYTLEGVGNKKYNESVVIKLWEEGKSEDVLANFAKEVESSSILEIRFNTPRYITMKKKYNLTMLMSNSGCRVGVDLKGATLNKGHTVFSFNSKLVLSDCFLPLFSIIFTY